MAASETKREPVKRVRPEELDDAALAALCDKGKLLLATTGLPGSGKTVWARHLLEVAACFVRVNSDDLREENPRRHEAVIRSLRDSRIKKALGTGQSVVVDNTNLRGMSDLRRLARENGADLMAVDFTHIPWQECVRRDAERAARGERATGRSVIIKMAMDAKLFEPDPSTNEEAVIIDLDGTLTDVSHRIHHLRGEQKNWKAFFEGIPGDKVNNAVAVLYHMIVRSGYTVLFVSGRPEDHRIPSEEWLRTYDLDDHFALFMRPINDTTPDTEVKGKIYDRYIKPYFNVVFTVDDRDQVVAMWRERGLVCFQVAEGNY